MGRRQASSAPPPAYEPGALPLAAIIGRPNVGKSTLFNRLTRSRRALVEDRPGVTRDRHYGFAEVFGKPYFLIDTGGLTPEADDMLARHILEQIQVAMEEADVLLCVFDGAEEPLEADRVLLRMAKQSGKPLIFTANKADSSRRTALAMAYYELGIEELLPVSALHAHGIARLEERLHAALPKPEAPENLHGDLPRIAVLGRPNAGKSSLTNHLLGEVRQVVDDVPGTTTTATETRITLGKREVVWVDTAGIRRRRSVEKGLESLSVLQAIDTMRRCDAVVLLVDGTEGAVEQDAKLIALIEDSGRAMVTALNKADLWNRESKEQLDFSLDTNLHFAQWSPRVRISAKTGQGLRRLQDAIEQVLHSHERRIPTAELNRFFDEVIAEHPPPTQSGKAPRIFYVTQASSKPPTFVAMTRHADAIRPSYKRYVQNRLRSFFGFEGTPLRVFFRDKSSR